MKKKKKKKIYLSWATVLQFKLPTVYLDVILSEV